MINRVDKGKDKGVCGNSVLSAHSSTNFKLLKTVKSTKFLKSKTSYINKTNNSGHSLNVFSRDIFT